MSECERAQQERAGSECESAQRERGAGRAGGLAVAPGGLSEERAR